MYTGCWSIGQICVCGINKHILFIRTEERVNVIKTALSHSDTSTFMDGADSMPALWEMGNAVVNLQEITMQILSVCSLFGVWLDFWFCLLVLLMQFYLQF